MKKPGHGDAPEFEETTREGRFTQYGMAAGCCGARVRASPSGQEVERAPGRQAVMRWQVQNAGRYRKLLRGGTVVPAIRAVALAFKRIKGPHQGFQRGGTRVPLRPFHADKRR